MSMLLFSIIKLMVLAEGIGGVKRNAHNRKAIGNCRPNMNKIWETTTPSLSLCSIHCLGDNRCLSVSYKQSDGTCVLHDVCPSNCSRVGIWETGWSLVCPEQCIHPLPSSCLEISLLRCGVRDGVYTIDTGEQSLQVSCDMTTAEGGWTVFQRRQDGSVDFYRGWNEYRDGFGDVENEFWLGNKNIHLLTKGKTCTLRIDLVNWDNIKGYAEYRDFSIDNEAGKFALHIGRYTGTAGDALTYQNGQDFSTNDRDLNALGRNCAVKWTGAWWYNWCHRSNLNGDYRVRDNEKGVQWRYYPASDYMRYTAMKLKCE